MKTKKRDAATQARREAVPYQRVTLPAAGSLTQPAAASAEPREYSLSLIPYPGLYAFYIVVGDMDRETRTLCIQKLAELCEVIVQCGLQSCAVFSELLKEIRIPAYIFTRPTPNLERFSQEIILLNPTIRAQNFTDLQADVFTEALIKGGWPTVSRQEVASPVQATVQLRGWQCNVAAQNNPTMAALAQGGWYLTTSPYHDSPESANFAQADNRSFLALNNESVRLNLDAVKEHLLANKERINGTTSPGATVSSLECAMLQCSLDTGLPPSRR